MNPSFTHSTVVAAMSGGVDSAVAAALLKQQGYDVIGVTLQIWQERTDQSRSGGCCSLGAVEDARRAAARIGIPHYVFNFREHFQNEVIQHFVLEYSRGRTPNPCVECNRRVKFRELLHQARRLGARYLATGHYARIVKDEASGRLELHRARDRAKDQSYALYMLTEADLDQVLFPIGELGGKWVTRRIASELGLPVAAKADSQEICFVPQEGYTAFLRERAPHTLRSGPIVDTSGRVLGYHEGLALYTIGQRRRLPASNSGPLYVVAMEASTNTLVVGEDRELYSRRFTVEDVSWVGEQPDFPLAVCAQIRYNADAVPARLFYRDASIQCELDEPQRAVTPGQAAVFYLGNRVLGGGTISRVED
ncbi:MAG: tRNA 2-thiouridine(34) synthase MnmA [Chthonomonadales bacterium]